MVSRLSCYKLLHAVLTSANISPRLLSTGSIALAHVPRSDLEHPPHSSRVTYPIVTPKKLELALLASYRCKLYFLQYSFTSDQNLHLKITSLFELLLFEISRQMWHDFWNALLVMIEVHDSLSISLERVCE